MTRIGSARTDENGKAHGGKAGDQKGGLEVSAQEWYKHSKGWIVLRAKSADVRKKLADCMQWACDNNNIGYDQYDRNTLYKAAEKVGFDCRKIETPVETDCSALVRVCLAYAGISVADFNTTSEAARIMATGKFDKLTDAKYTDFSSLLLRGDILVTPTKGHTVIVLDDGEEKQKEKQAALTVKIEPSPKDKDPALNRYWTTTGRVYLRTGAGIDKKIVCVMPEGTRFRCYGYWNERNGRVWLLGVAKVDGLSVTGWASTLYLK